MGIALVEGVPAASASTGIPERTIYVWQESEEFAELRARTKDQVADEWWAGIQKGFRAVIAGFDGDDPLQQKATAAAILFDKLALMRGEATSRSESRDLTKVYDDHELTTLRDFIDTIDGPAGTAGDTGEPATVAATPGAEVR